MAHYKGADTKGSINAETFDLGQKVTLEIGDWNGTGFAYRQNGNAKPTAYVVDVESDYITLVEADDRAAWNLTTDRDEAAAMEFRVYENGDVSGWAEHLSTNSTVKEAEKVGEPKDYKVANGAERWGHSGYAAEETADETCPNCGSADLKEGVAADPETVADFGCLDCGEVWG